MLMSPRPHLEEACIIENFSVSKETLSRDVSSVYSGKETFTEGCSDSDLTLTSVHFRAVLPAQGFVTQEVRLQMHLAGGKGLAVTLYSSVLWAH